MKNFSEDFFFEEHLRLCPWPRAFLSLASDFFVSLALVSSLKFSTPPLVIMLVLIIAKYLLRQELF